MASLLLLVPNTCTCWHFSVFDFFLPSFLLALGSLCYVPEFAEEKKM